MAATYTRQQLIRKVRARLQTLDNLYSSPIDQNDPTYWDDLIEQMEREALEYARLLDAYTYEEFPLEPEVIKRKETSEEPKEKQLVGITANEIADTPEYNARIIALN